MDEDEVKGTHSSYEQIAAVYARERQHRHLMAALTRRFVTLVPAGGLVLDVGCGPGADTAVLRQQGLRAVGLDYSRSMMLAGRTELGLDVPFVQADMRHLPIPCCVDGIWCCAALLHLRRSDVPAALRGFRRVLRPGGTLFLSLKLGAGEGWSPHSYGHEAPRFFTYWQPDKMDGVLAASGFAVVDGWEMMEKPVPWLVRFAQ